MTGISIDFLGLTPPVPPMAPPAATGASFSGLVAGMLATHARPAPPVPVVAAPATPVPTLPLDRQDVAGQDADPRAEEDGAAPIIVDLTLFDPIPLAVTQPVPAVRPLAPAAEAIAAAPVAAIRNVGMVQGAGQAVADAPPEPTGPAPAPQVAASAVTAAPPAPPPVAGVPFVRDIERRVGADLRAMLKAFAPGVSRPADAPAAAAEQPAVGGDVQPSPVAVANDAPRIAPAIAPRGEPQNLSMPVAAPVAVAPIVGDGHEPAPVSGVADAPLATAAAPPAPVAVREAVIVQRMPPVDTGRAEWIETLVDRIDDARGQGAARITQIRLMPDALGTVDIRIQQDADRVHVQFSTDTAQARTLLTEAQPRLADLAEARGLKLGDTGVQHGAGGQRHADRDEPRADRPNRLIQDGDPDGTADETGDRIA